MVTGGATGIGSATCLKLSSLGTKVVINYSNSVQEARIRSINYQILGYCIKPILVTSIKRKK
ncbi:MULTISPECIES: hypothetical protein [unclassified Lysinibacillus]|uniref:hypothetical protein n=1 Tax=Lysinibacillus sp. Bpr_S20 TaxID=2933964 RepID=UPI0027E2E126|nr:hypothetical protein [Lysinibacillus sp. BPa_S21]